MFLSLKEELQGINDMIRNYPSPITGCDEQFNYLLGKRAELKKRIGELSENPEIKMWKGGNINGMGIKTIQYKESHLEEIRSILTEYITFIANELLKPPGEFNVDVEHEIDFTINNLDQFEKPDGRLLLVEVDGQIAGTISLRKIRNDSGEIKRMFVRPKFRGKKLGNLMIEEVIEIAKENGYSKLYLDTAQYMSSTLTLYKKFGFEETEPYPECIVPKEFWEKLIFMKKEL